MSRKRRPLRIGISARIYHPHAGARGIQSKSLQYLEQSVAHWAMSRDVMVFMIPSVNSDGQVYRSNIRLSDYAEYLDGLILQGGADISPQCYGEEPLHPDWIGDRVRDAYEMELLHEFIESGKAVLGICRGAQLINVALGGSLYQDIVLQVEGAASHVHEDFDHHAHAVTWNDSSVFSKLYPGLAGGRVISIHHQAIKALGRGLRVEARSVEDEVIEAVRLETKPYVFGLQWHPEFHSPGAPDLLDCIPILDEFLDAAYGQRWWNRRAGTRKSGILDAVKGSFPKGLFHWPFRRYLPFRG
ncbi:MAG: type 1 glutamine amidotransferase [Candidatus Accumulibacter sp.]|jgi:putative glutamine amidotransferase|nr:type 1 glutamine amidotransferase [Accumulibacter sp.]